MAREAPKRETLTSCSDLNSSNIELGVTTVLIRIKGGEEEVLAKFHRFAYLVIAHILIAGQYTRITPTKRGYCFTV